MRQNQATKITNLMEEVGWAGTREEFMETLLVLLNRVPDPYRTFLHRYYVLDETQERDPTTGKPVSNQERFFYQHTQTGRAALKTVFALNGEDLKRLGRLKREGVC